MNHNIERINKHLFAVRFSWVRQGWIKEFSLPEGTENNLAAITPDGAVVMNKDDPVSYHVMRRMMVYVAMPKTDNQLSDMITLMETCPELLQKWDQQTADMTLFCLRLERDRRLKKRKK